MRVVEIYDFLEKSGQWTSLGHVYEKDVLTKAQELANGNQAVVAIYLEKQARIGNIALILPGELEPSGSWGFRAPNSSSFFINEPELSYVNKALSYAFRKRLVKDVLIYVRKY